MESVSIRDLFQNTARYAGKTICVGGWVRSVRASKAFGFIVLHDGTFFTPLQVVYHDNLDNFQEISKTNVGAALVVTGTLVETPEAKQPFELQAESVVVEGASAPDYPLQKKRHSLEYLRTMTHLRPRTNTFQAVFRVRSASSPMPSTGSSRSGALSTCTLPSSPASDCEGAGEMFQVTTLDLQNLPLTEEGKVDFTQDFFSKPTNLTVSGQLNGETYAMAFKNIYTFGPTFRAENSNTTRHAAEFWMIEPEIAFADLKDDMQLAEDMIKYIISLCAGACAGGNGLLQPVCGQGPAGPAESCAHLRFWPRDLHGGCGNPGEAQRQVRVPRPLGQRPADGARALPHGGGLQTPRFRHRLPQGDQGLLYAA